MYLAQPAFFFFSWAANHIRIWSEKVFSKPLAPGGQMEEEEPLMEMIEDVRTLRKKKLHGAEDISGARS